MRCENLRIKYLSLQDLIEKKYPEVNFNEVSQNIESGFGDRFLMRFFRFKNFMSMDTIK